MNSSSSTTLDSNPKMLLTNLAIPDQLHIASIEYTVDREKGRVKSLLVEILFLPEDKKKKRT